MVVEGEEFCEGNGEGVEGNVCFCVNNDVLSVIVIVIFVIFVCVVMSY